MMQTSNNPRTATWSSLCRRPTQNRDTLEATIRDIYKQVEEGGDSALLDLTERFDHVQLENIAVQLDMVELEAKKLSEQLKTAIDQAYENIRKFHSAQRRPTEKMIETVSGVWCWRELRPIETVGLYVPGGSAPLISTMLMLGVPAVEAGCKTIVVCTPPDKTGVINPAIRYAAAKCGISTLYAIGGAQAIAAMTLGTGSIPKVDKLFGPGNQYVTAAKQFAERYGVAADMPAGPSEVLVIADDTANPAFVAADLLSQAEHGSDSQVVLLTTSQVLRRRVRRELEEQLVALPRRKTAGEALANSLDIYFDELTVAFDFANKYAPEHIILQVQDAKDWAAKVINAGSVFVGAFTPESAGDYASGTNHTLPTAGWAKSYSGLSVSSFQHTVTFQSISTIGLSNLSNTIIMLAEAEGLTAHARAVSIRQNTL